MNQVTMKEIAARAGVSRPTVSRVLNNKTDLVTKETRERILKIAAELNYQPNFQAVNLKTKKSFLLGVDFSPRLPFVDPAYQSQLQRGMTEAVRGTEYGLVLHSPWLSKEKAVAMVRSNRIDGFIDVVLGNGSLFQQKNAPVLKENGVPFVLLHISANPELDFPNVGSDRREAGRMATRHLIGRGHTRIGLAGDTRTQVDRYSAQEGYIAALAEAGLTGAVDDLFPLRLLPDTEGGDEYRFVAERALSDPLPSAFVCTDDDVAYNLIDLLGKQGIRVPEDVAIVSARQQFMRQDAVRVPLTSVRHDVAGTGRMATRMLLDMLEHPEKIGQPQQKIADLELTVRQSCGAGI